MSVIRRRHNKNFTVIGNEVFSDESLELDALGLLCYLRSRPNDWHIRTDQLCRRFGCGPEKMQRLMRALQDTGWVIRQEAPRKAGGRYGGLEYVVLDEPERASDDVENSAGTSEPREAENPVPVPESDQPTPADRESDEPESDEPESENPTAYKELDSTKGFSPLNPPVAGGTCSSQDRMSEREALAGGRPEPDTARRRRRDWPRREGDRPAVALSPEAQARFDRLWAAFPDSGRLSARKGEAVARFDALSEAEQLQAIRTATAYAATCGRQRSQAKALHRWLRDGLWRNGELALGPGSAPASPTRMFVREGSAEWQAWAEHYRRSGRIMPTPTAIGGQEGWRFDSAWPPGWPAGSEVA